MKSMPRERGSFILEAMVSLLIFTIALIGLVALATQSVNQLGQSKSRNDASFLASELIGELWVTADSATTYRDAWKASDRVVAALAALGRGHVAVSGTEIADSGAGEPCSTESDLTTTRVFICISWADAKNSGTRHFYRTATQIVKN